MLVSNNPYELTHLSGAGTRERIDTGTLGIVAARVRGADVSKLVALELVGQARRFPGLLSWSARDFEVRSAGPVAIGLDGEALVLEPPLRFNSLPGALRVRVPRGAGLSPAARAVALTRDEPRRAGARGGRPVSRAAARLLLGLAAFVLLAWGLGELWTVAPRLRRPERGAGSRGARSPALTDAARVITWAGSAAVLVPLALIVCCCSSARACAARRLRSR